MESLFAACGITLTPMERKSKMKHFLPQRAEKRKKKKKRNHRSWKKKEKIPHAARKIEDPMCHD